MESEIIHRWRCMNCGEMADSYICQHCGKASFIEKESDEKANKALKEPESVVTVLSEGKSNVSYNEIINEALNSIKISIKNQVFNETKKLETVLCCLFGAILILSLVTTVMCLKINGRANTLAKSNNNLNSIIISQSEKIDVLQKQIGNYEKNGIKCIVHTVKSGENLEMICNSHNIDYLPSKKIILSLNGIENPNMLNVGQKIILVQVNGENR